MGTRPTNDIEERREGACSRACPHCGISECITVSHQNWDCRCGHGRKEHVYRGYQYVRPGVNCPHPCAVSDCPCEGLVYKTIEDMVSELVLTAAHLCPNFWDDFT